MTVTQVPGQVPAGEVVAELLDRSDERDLHEALRHADYHRGFLDGARDQYSAGYAAAVADVKSAQHDLVDEVGVELRRWHVCCRPCRVGGHQAGCTRCQDRTRATFGRRHPDDYPGQAGAA